MQIEQLSAELMSQIHGVASSMRLSIGGAGPNHRVFAVEATGVLVVLRGVEEADGAHVVYGPASFASCLGYVNGRIPNDTLRIEPGPTVQGPRATGDPWSSRDEISTSSPAGPSEAVPAP
jgi:hypothetical protein